jgi:hypothetical protein
LAAEIDRAQLAPLPRAHQRAPLLCTPSRCHEYPASIDAPLDKLTVCAAKRPEAKPWKVLASTAGEKALEADETK